jgi:acetyl-CoA C-acetyltransferase
VLVGLGSVNDSASVSELMTRAVRAAADDAGAPSLFTGLDHIMVPQGSWSLTDPARTVARGLGAAGARTVLCEIGVSQQEVINRALTMVAHGESDAVAIVGGEARAWARSGGVESDEERGPPDQVLTRPPEFVAAIEIAAGMAWPVVQQYALIENALGAAEAHTGSAQNAEIAALWARFNEVAQANPAAAFPAPLTAEEIARPGPANRPLASPYNLWHSSQWTVDQASALLVCSAERAAAVGVAPDRWLFPHVALHCSSAVTLTARRRLHTWPAMGVLGRAAAARLGRPLHDIGLAELYSCFPVAVRIQQRELGLARSGTPTLTGGMAFAGGPFNHYVLLSTVTMGRRLREDPGQLGLVTTVSGMLSKPGLAVWSATPPADGGLVADLAAEADAATETVPVLEAGAPSAGQGVVVSATVTYGGPDRLEPERTAIVADLPDGVRTAATCEDAATARAALAEGLVGRTVELKDTTFRI